ARGGGVTGVCVIATLSGTAASRRSVLRALTAAASALTLGGCASLASTVVRFDASALSAKPSLLVATTRKPVDGARANPWFGPERASALSVARAYLTPPDDGRFTLSSVGLTDWRLDRVEPLPQVGDLWQATSGRDVLIFV